MAKTRTATQTKKPAVSRSTRLEARITPALKALIERAAAYEGRSLTDFMVGALSTVAEAVVRDHEVIRLTSAQSRAFVEILLNATPPNKQLRKAARKYRRVVESR